MKPGRRMKDTAKTVAIAAVSFIVGVLAVAAWRGMPREQLLPILAIGFPVTIAVATIIALIKNYSNPAK